MGFITHFLDGYSSNFLLALLLWPFASFVLTLPIIALLYHRDGKMRLTTVGAAYLTVLYILGLACFTLYPLPSGDSGPGITYGIPPQLNPLGFIGDVAENGKPAVLQIVANIIFFIPLGFIAHRLLRLGLAKSLLLGFLVSLCIETTQLTGLFFIYPYSYRTFDVCDLMWNTSGTALGWACALLLARVLPAPKLEDVAITHHPGLVRRCTAFCLDMFLVGAGSITAGVLAHFAWDALSITSPDAATVTTAVSFAVNAALLLIIEWALPWKHDGSTPGGGFIRMSCETKERTGAKRALFYVVRLATFFCTFIFFSVLAPALAVFYLIARRMPYDYLP